jgi:hypothetical protein
MAKPGVSTAKPGALVSKASVVASKPGSDTAPIAPVSVAQASPMIAGAQEAPPVFALAAAAVALVALGVQILTMLG